MKSSSTRAFTLIETMIVLAIFGVVIGIAMPAFLRAREVSSARACQENLAQISGAINIYAAEKKLAQDDPVTLANLVMAGGTGYLRATPLCPSAGTYTVTDVKTDPVCSIGANVGAPFAPHDLDIPVPASP